MNFILIIALATSAVPLSVPGYQSLVECSFVAHAMKDMDPQVRAICIPGPGTLAKMDLFQPKPPGEKID